MVVGAVILAASVTFSTLLVAVLVFAGWRRDRRERSATAARHPAGQSLPRRFALPCECCSHPIRYQVHPDGQEDAVALHLAFECEAQLAVRRSR